MNWLLLQSGAGEPAWNMALDAALLQSAAQTGKPILRFYSWTQPAATFGYFQKYSEVEKLTPLRPLIRRTTGGGIVPHDADWTYSLGFPPDDAWFRLSACESYQRAHGWIRDAFTKLGVTTELAPSARIALPGQCFEGHEKHDLLWHGKKIAGAAQRRNKLGLLIQGSVQPPPAIAKADWQKAMCDVAHSNWNANWQNYDLDATVTTEAEQLRETKFASATFLKKR